MEPLPQPPYGTFTITSLRDHYPYHLKGSLPPPLLHTTIIPTSPTHHHYPHPSYTPSLPPALLHTIITPSSPTHHHYPHLSYTPSLPHHYPTSPTHHHYPHPSYTPSLPPALLHTIITPSSPTHHHYPHLSYTPLIPPTTCHHYYYCNVSRYSHEAIIVLKAAIEISNLSASNHFLLANIYAVCMYVTP